MPVFDPDRFSEITVSTLAEVFGYAISALADRDNVSLWTAGHVPSNDLSKIDPVAHFESFSAALVAAATKVSCDGEGKFAASDLKAALSQPRVFHYLSQIHPQSSDEDLLRFAQVYIDGAIASEVRRRHHISTT